FLGVGRIPPSRAPSRRGTTILKEFRINIDICTIRLSCREGTGMELWLILRAAIPLYNLG
ncbi:hypothetical protein, partial [Bacteroides heparinolyticus]|uniref:hypothetical protein n=1 Tax=Prevotella heparinolytica TaxID=28113 RepID=UPI0035A0F878